jgi:steroid delta-isomerase-like uncharacterized protein
MTTMATISMKQHSSIRNESLKAYMKTHLLITLGLILCSYIYGQNANTKTKEDMNDYKKAATLWYEAFTKNDPTILDRILSEDWVDIPSPPGTPSGPKGVKPLLAALKTTFPDLNLTIKDVLQDGNKVVVRAEMAGTQKEAFMSFPSKNRKMSIQVVDIHEFKDGKIVRTWHTEDWMTGLRQLGVFEK